jgi:hypothetical protein
MRGGVRFQAPFLTRIEPKFVPRVISSISSVSIPNFPSTIEGTTPALCRPIGPGSALKFILRKCTMATPSQLPMPEKYLVAFVIQGDDVFKITSDNILHTCGNAGEFAFQGIAKLRAAAALEQLTAIHNERPEELRKMAREMAREGMALLARTSSAARPSIERIA